MTRQRAKMGFGWIVLTGLLTLSFGEMGRAVLQDPAQAAEAPGVLHLMVGRTLVITSPARLKRVSIADPNIADAIVVSPNQIQLNGKAAGAVSLVLWDETDQSQTFDLFVDLDILGVSQKVREAFPEEQVQVEATRDVVTVSGRVSSQAIGDKILQLVAATSPKAISLMQVPPPVLVAGEILLQVKFAEVDRSALSQFGFNFVSFGGGPLKTTATSTTQQFAPPQLRSSQDLSTTIFSFSDLLNIFLFRPDVDLGATIRALQQQNLLQILAEPNLLTQTGKEANFLAGGEFPFPVLQAGTAFGGVTIQFREFGVRLNFTPTLISDGRIHLKVRPEVSALDFANALTISGFVIPALSTRRVESEMDLGDGQSFAIAGLVDDRLTQTLSKVPLLGDIPVLGQFFRSRSTNKSKTELLVVVTPRIVRPAPLEPLPAGPQFPKPFLPPAASEEAIPPAPR